MSGRLTLYGMGSPNVRKVGILLEELELDYALIHVGVFRGEQFAPDFPALNPFAKVPVLVDPALDRPLFESGAILLSLAERHGRFLPAAGDARYETICWLMAQMASVGPMFGQLNHFRLLPPGSEPYAEARYAAQAERLYRTLDDRLAGREWIAGDGYSIADMAMHPWAHYLEQHGLAPEHHPALLAWRGRIDARPAVRRSAERFAAAFAAPSLADRKGASADDLDRFFHRTDAVPPADYGSVQRM